MRWPDGTIRGTLSHNRFNCCSPRQLSTTTTRDVYIGKPRAARNLPCITGSIHIIMALIYDWIFSVDCSRHLVRSISYILFRYNILWSIFNIWNFQLRCFELINYFSSFQVNTAASDVIIRRYLKRVSCLKNCKRVNVKSQRGFKRETSHLLFKNAQQLAHIVKEDTNILSSLFILLLLLLLFLVFFKRRHPFPMRPGANCQHFTGGITTTTSTRSNSSSSKRENPTAALLLNIYTEKHPSRPSSCSIGRDGQAQQPLLSN